MALRAREARLVRGVVDQENVKAIVKNKPTVAVGQKRAVLSEVSANTTASNKPKEVLKKEPFTKPAPVALKTKDLAKPALAVQNVSSKSKKPQTKAPVKPFLSERSLGLKKNDFVSTSATKHTEKPATVVPTDVVEDIDKEDIGKPFLVPDYACEIYEYLRHLESRFPVRENYLSGQKITPRMRATLVDWLVDVQQNYHLFTETLHLGVAIIDMFLQKVMTITKERLQLVGVSAILVACKYEETYSPDISDFVYITDKSFSKEQILAMEKYICGKLDFMFGRPLSIHFLRRYSKAAFATPLQHSIAKYFLELALVDALVIHWKPSFVAATSCYLALLITNPDIDQDSLWTPTLAKYSSYTFKQLKPSLPTMASVIVKAPSSKLQSVRKKYSSSKFQKVSVLPELESEKLKKLADLS